MEFRKSGISIVGDVRWGTHFCHFYETKQDLLDTLIPYFKAGLESHEFCFWVVSGSELLTPEEAKGALKQAVPDLERQLSNGNIEIVDSLDWYLAENAFDIKRVTGAWDAKLKRALDLGYEGMRVSGDTFWLRGRDWKGFCAYEQILNDSIADRPITLLCTYPLAKSGAGEILDIVQTHQFALARRHGEWKVIESPELIQAKTEIKRLDEELQRVVERAPAPPVIWRYGVAVLSVTAALMIARYLDSHLVPASGVLLLCALMFSAWYGGVKPGLLAMALSLLAFKYYFVTPIHSLTVEINEIPRLVIFALASVFVVSLSAAQRRAAESLRHARDVMEGIVQQLKRANDSLHVKIAERKRVEALLHSKEQEFRAIVENAPDQIIRYDRAFRRTYVNPAVARAYGLPAEALIGKAIGSVVEDAGLTVNDGELAHIRQRIADVFATGKSCEYELNFPIPTGRKDYNVRLFPERDLNGSVVNVLGISRDITEGKRAEEQLRTTSEQLRALSARLQSAREEEATRIAREIHDELGQALTAIKLEFAALIRDLQPEGSVRLRSQSILKLLDETIHSIRRIATELRPGILDDLGLAAAVEWVTGEFHARTGTTVEASLPAGDVEMDRERATALFRILQETLTNVARHAKATRVSVRLAEEDGILTLEVHDNGQGIDGKQLSASHSLGILGMRERALMLGGELTISGSPGLGTTVRVRIPETASQPSGDHR